MLTCNWERRQRRPTGRKQRRDRRPGSQEHGGPDRSKTFSQGQSPQKWRARPLGAKLPTRSQEKQSRVVDAVGGHRIRHEKEKGARIVACSLRLRVAGTRIKEANGERGVSRRQEHRAGSGARRPVGRAGPRGELDAPQLPLLGLHPAPAGVGPRRAAVRFHHRHRWASARGPASTARSTWNWNSSAV